MKKTLIVLLLSMICSISAVALSTEIQYDMLKVKLTQELKDKEYSKVPDTINRIKSLGVSTPESFDYFEGKALFESGKKAKSYSKFERYISNTGKQGKYYSPALSYMNNAESAYYQHKEDQRKQKLKREQEHKESIERDINAKRIWVDNSTGLMWQDNAIVRFLDYDQARDYCTQLKLRGFTDWRVPTYYELISIIDYTRDTYIKKELKANLSGTFYSSSVAPKTKYDSYFKHTYTYQWGVDFLTGNIALLIANPYRKPRDSVRCVRNN